MYSVSKMYLKAILVILFAVAVIGTYIIIEEQRQFDNYYDAPILPMETDKIA